jgi:hypothetical protein
MFKKVLVFISSVLLLINIYGCVALFAGAAAGGVGTAVWLSGKMVQRVDVSFEQAEQAARAALQSQKFPVLTKDITAKGIVQIRSKDINGQKVWVDIYRITDMTAQIEVRVGTFVSNKDAASRILRSIVENLQVVK